MRSYFKEGTVTIRKCSGESPHCFILHLSTLVLRSSYVMDTTCCINMTFRGFFWSMWSHFCLFSGITSCNFLLCCRSLLFSLRHPLQLKTSALKILLSLPFSSPFFPPSWATDLTQRSIQWPQSKKELQHLFPLSFLCTPTVAHSLDSWLIESEAERTKWKERRWLQVPLGKGNASTTAKVMTVFGGDGVMEQTPDERCSSY